MKTIFFLFIILLFIVAGCKKTITENYGENGLNATDTTGVYGVWQWVVSRSGLVTDSAASDTVITLTLRPDHSYAIGSNGSLARKGSFTITVDGSNDSLIHFSNFQQTTTGTGPGSVIPFITYTIGQLTFFGNDELSMNNNFLVFLSYPVSPEAYIAYFSKQ